MNFKIIYFYFIFLGGGGGVRKINNFFEGKGWAWVYDETVDFFGGHRKTGLFLGVISKHSRI